MVLFIDTTDPESAHLAWILNEKQIVKHDFQVERNLSERLIPEIQKFIKKQKIKLADLKKIAVITGPGQFSKLRTAVATTNALGFGLDVPIVGIKLAEKNNWVKILKQAGTRSVKPLYDRGPNITLSKKTL